MRALHLLEDIIPLDGMMIVRVKKSSNIIGARNQIAQIVSVGELVNSPGLTPLEVNDFIVLDYGVKGIEINTLDQNMEFDIMMIQRNEILYKVKKKN